MCDVLQIYILANEAILSDFQQRIRQVNIPYLLICCTSNLDHAMSRIASDPPDLIFAETSSFDTAPLHLIKMLRANCMDANIILSTQSLDYALIRQALELGIKDILKYPVESEKLADILSSSLRAKCGIVGAVYQSLMESYPQSVNISEIARRYLLRFALDLQSRMGEQLAAAQYSDHSELNDLCILS